MATNFFEIGYHFKTGDQLLGIGYYLKIFRSQVAAGKKKLISSPGVIFMVADMVITPISPSEVVQIP